MGKLIEQVLAVPPPYRATPGSAVYVLHAGDRAVLMGEENLIGSLRDLVMTIMAAGDPALAAQRCCHDLEADVTQLAAGLERTR